MQIFESDRFFVFFSVFMMFFFVVLLSDRVLALFLSRCLKRNIPCCFRRKLFNQVWSSGAGGRRMVGEESGFVVQGSLVQKNLYGFYSLA